MPITIDGLDDIHAKVAIDILTGDAQVPVYRSATPDNVAPPYVLIYSAVTWPSVGIGDALDGRSGTCVTRWFVNCVGSTEAAALSVSNRARQLLLNVRPAIAGRSCGLIKQDPADIPPERDETTGTLIVNLRTQYVLTTT